MIKKPETTWGGVGRLTDPKNEWRNQVWENMCTILSANMKLRERIVFLGQPKQITAIWVEISSLRILENRNLKWRYRQAHTSSRDSRGESFLASFRFQGLQVLPGLRLPTTSIQQFHLSQMGNPTEIFEDITKFIHAILFLISCHSLFAIDKILKKVLTLYLAPCRGENLLPSCFYLLFTVIFII